ncbi:hypothetical protein STIUS_v1c04650 [Spiroplasma sp. TIUS-1]|uniref:BspA family leucine-rich repeat surface protein n=1 Tax=Spiroplasma sp. TIUS-1 TaxID=216963 RepID=UPI001398DD9F|nr:BspA family leucine-rich repeat surface protein [Spiroplasma sp. TIUS-1]QHX36019.1 hypothetical protein STIUS_v1c04650 [Spiroplasma sp. TIUS-1]
MKKLLAMLGAAALVVSTSTVLVSCGPNESNGDQKIVDDLALKISTKNDWKEIEYTTDKGIEFVINEVQKQVNDLLIDNVIATVSCDNIINGDFNVELKKSDAKARANIKGIKVIHILTDKEQVSLVKEKVNEHAYTNIVVDSEDAALNEARKQVEDVIKNVENTSNIEFEISKKSFLKNLTTFEVFIKKSEFEEQTEIEIDVTITKDPILIEQEKVNLELSKIESSYDLGQIDENNEPSQNDINLKLRTKIEGDVNLEIVKVSVENVSTWIIQNGSYQFNISLTSTVEETAKGVKNDIIVKFSYDDGSLTEQQKVDNELSKVKEKYQVGKIDISTSPTEKDLSPLLASKIEEDVDTSVVDIKVEYITSRIIQNGSMNFKVILTSVKESAALSTKENVESTFSYDDGSLTEQQKVDNELSKVKEKYQVGKIDISTSPTEKDLSPLLASKIEEDVDTSVVDIKVEYITSRIIQNGSMNFKVILTSVKESAALSTKENVESTFSYDDGTFPEKQESIYEGNVLTQIGYSKDENGIYTMEPIRIDTVEVPKELPSQIQSLKLAFKGNQNQKIINIEQWNTSNIIDMSSMFESAMEFNQDISKWNTENVKNMSSMFKWSINFNNNISLWDTSKVQNMSSMFEGAMEFNQNISMWDVTKVTNWDSFSEGTDNWFNEYKPVFNK